MRRFDRVEIKPMRPPASPDFSLERGVIHEMVKGSPYYAPYYGVSLDGRTYLVWFLENQLRKLSLLEIIAEAAI